MGSGRSHSPFGIRPCVVYPYSTVYFFPRGEKPREETGRDCREAEKLKSKVRRKNRKEGRKEGRKQGRKAGRQAGRQEGRQEGEAAVREEGDRAGHRATGGWRNPRW